MKYTLNTFTKEYHKLADELHRYRLGQHFINRFIKDSSTPEMQELWNEWDYSKAFTMIHDFIEANQWDYYDLPLIKKDHSYMKIRKTQHKVWEVK